MTIQNNPNTVGRSAPELPFYDVIIVGTGDLGGRVGRALMTSGHTVLGLNRSPSEPGFEVSVADINHEASIPRLKCKTLLFSVAARDRSVHGYQATYVNGLNHVISAIEFDHLINISSTRVFKDQKDGWVNDQSPLNATSELAQPLIEAAQIASRRGTNLFLGGIYGPGRDRLIRLARDGGWSAPGHCTNRIHIEDATLLTALLIETTLKSGALPNAIIGVDGQAAEMAEVLDWLREQTGSSKDPDQKIPTRGVGKKCRSGYLKQIEFSFQYPDFQSGYRSLLNLEE